MWSLVKVNFVIVLDHSIPLFFSFTPIVPRCYSIGGNTDKDLIKGLVVVVVVVVVVVGGRHKSIMLIFMGIIL